jgi:phospholipid/cholesterol/gamma-HCH transport system substrate-binding protein
MAIQNRATWARLKVGILAIFAMTILAVLIFLITGQTDIFESQVLIYTYMADAAALTNGAPVNLNGIPIGKVKSIRLSGSKDPMRLVRIDMQVPTSQLKNIPSDSLASISSANVLGTKYINIKSGKGNMTVGPDQELPSVNTGEIQDLVQQGFGVLNSLQDTVQRVDKIVGLVESGKGSIGKLLVDETLYNNLLQILAQVKGLADALNSDKGTIGVLLNNRELYDNFRATLGRVDTMLQQLQDGQGSAGKFLKDPALYDDLHASVKGVQKLIDDLNAGKGTAGQLLKSDDLSNQLKATISKIDSIIDKVDSGQGTIGQLLVNQQLYDNLNGATREMHLLMQDFRANPKKFLRIKLSIF